MDRKEGWAPKNWCFQIVLLEKTPEISLDSKESKPVNPKGNHPWIFIGMTDANLENSAVATVFVPIPKKGNAKECSNYCTIALISHASKVMHKILQNRLQQYVNHELPDVQVGFRKGRETRDQIANICWIIQKAREFQKTSISALLTMPKPLTVWITRNCGKFWKRWEYQTTWPASWEICVQVRKQQLELGMEQQTGSK